MPVLQYGGLKISLDEEGYLLNPEDWNEKVACAIAEREGIDELTEDRMAIILFMREYFKKFNSFPLLGSVCKNIHEPKNCVTEAFIDPLKAWKIAGLPKPVEEVVSYIQHPK